MRIHLGAVALVVATGCGSVQTHDDGGTGDSAGGSDAAVDGPAIDAMIDAAVISHRVFISRMSYTGNLGGTSGGDAKCQTVAEGVGFTGLWRAYLSTSTVDARDRLPTTGRFVRVTGEVIANDKADLLDGTLAGSILFDETGTERTPNRAWTGTAANGTAIASTTCTDWTLGTTTSVAGLIGDAGGTDQTWTNLQNSGCGGTQRLYCIEQ